MPNNRYRLKKQRGSKKYFVVSEKTGRKFSKKALSKSRARRQQQALYASQRVRGGHYGCGRCGCSMYGGSCGCSGTSGGRSPDYGRALALGAASGLLTNNRNVGLGVGLGSIGFDLIR